MGAGFDDVFKASGSWLLAPGTRQTVGRTDKRAAEGLQKKKIKCIVAIPTRRDVEISISEEEIFSYFRHETLKIASLVLRNAHVLVFPVSTFRVVNHGISTWGRSGDVFFFSSRPKKVRKPVAVAVQESGCFFFFFAGARSRFRVIVTLTRAAQGRDTHTHPIDRSIEWTTRTATRERERERKSEARAPPVWTL